jgi:hypothetical protein
MGPRMDRWVVLPPYHYQTPCHVYCFQVIIFDVEAAMTAKSGTCRFNEFRPREIHTKDLSFFTRGGQRQTPQPTGYSGK